MDVGSGRTIPDFHMVALPIGIDAPELEVGGLLVVAGDGIDVAGELGRGGRFGVRGNEGTAIARSVDQVDLVVGRPEELAVSGELGLGLGKVVVDRGGERHLLTGPFGAGLLPAVESIALNLLRTREGAQCRNEHCCQNGKETFHGYRDYYLRGH